MSSVLAMVDVTTGLVGSAIITVPYVLFVWFVRPLPGDRRAVLVGRYAVMVVATLVWLAVVYNFAVAPILWHRYEMCTGIWHLIPMSPGPSLCIAPT